ncbi:hypothetical protein DFH07DRAFT_833811 [Mycena maculata]|uniref:Uncharacterized protein n=1 Tax=Mycena maculata TaxID=230809 RepID=A0AAD7IKK7_9AGAR|nr:hypothetical protein DFH07DRAFT_833811 [Mycena maculata]
MVFTITITPSTDMATIDAQKTAVQRDIHDLKNEENTVQGENNVHSDLDAIWVDPMERFPVEISSDIMLRCLPTPPQLPDPKDAPMILLNICHLQNKIALSTPALWTSVKLIDRWLGRAATRPLTLHCAGR